MATTMVKKFGSSDRDGRNVEYKTRSHGTATVNAVAA
jgi:hypothetical protein